METAERKCRKCGQVFSPRPWQIAKSDHTCRICTNARDAAAKLRYSRKPDRRVSRNPERQAAYQAAYDATPESKAKRAVYRAARRVRDDDFQRKLAVRAQTRRAIRSGHLVRQACEVCGASDVEAHHDDYSRPLSVRWLCTTHHREHHKRQRAQASR
ncbi:hypothetical protein [Caulobacter sp. FWC2]|uniref:hypothetical protein n=1 Tax=Caulobacter sp. FWC2 TaxID=69664 RepID=UPI00117770A3|nr:hypothetical protein [Caulobacter sp. FWC2]